MSYAVASRAMAPGLLAGHAVIARIRRLLILTLIVGVVYSAVTAASAGGCLGGVDGSGGFIDSQGRPTDVAPMCVQVTLRPSPLVFVAIGLIVLLALGRVLKAVDEQTALRTLDRAAAGIGVLAVVAIVVSHVWFQLVPVQELMAGSWTVFSPFPFGTIDVTTDPMTGTPG